MQTDENKTSRTAEIELIKSKKIELVPLKEIKLNKKNSNRHPPEQIERLANIIRYQGFREPGVISNLSGVLIAGEGRYLAAKKLGLKKMPVIFQDFDSEEQEYAFGVSTNSIASWAELDLGLINLELENMGPDFDLEMLGLKDFELDPADKYADKDADEIPEVKESITKTGDLWLLGEHRVLCGDCTVKENVERLDISSSVLMVTDPPYGVDYTPEWRNDALGEANSSIGLVKNDTRIDWSDTYKLFTGNVIYVWHDGRRAKRVQENIEDCGFEVVSQIIWAKQHFALSRGDYHWKHEPCWYAVRKGQNHNWQGARDQSTLWEINNGLSQGGGKQEESTGHGTQKPVECMLRPIVNNSKASDAIYDPFLGSGSTLIACEKTNRKCFGMEIDPHYVSIIVERWCKYTGNEAYRENSDGSKTSWTDAKKEAWA